MTSIVGVHLLFIAFVSLNLKNKLLRISFYYTGNISANASRTEAAAEAQRQFQELVQSSFASDTTVTSVTANDI